MRWRRDEIDDWCDEWAITRRRIYGVTLDKMLDPRERLGKLRSTLASVHDEREGAAYTKASQNWPEVYTPMGIMIHRCQLTMTGDMRDTLHLHYVFNLAQWPLENRCKDYGITLHFHWKNLAVMKIYINGFVAATPEPNDEAILATRY